VSDRELLELAAKAAGGIDYRHDNTLGTKTIARSGQTTICNCGARWNPLDDDGDALRLAVKLGLLGAPAHIINFIAAKGDTDPDAATRRAITRAAAEIGRNMK
jgi:hypothetical protein